MKLALDIKPLSLSWLRWTTSRDTVVRYADFSSEFVSRVRGLPDVDDAAVTFFHGIDRRDGIRNGRSASLHWRERIQDRVSVLSRERCI